MIRIDRRALFCLPAFFLMALSVEARSDDPKTLELGASAPDFNLPGVDGRNYTLADFAHADILVVVFTCNHCPTAQAYEDRIMQIAADYRERGVALVAISPNDPLAIRLDELGYTDMNDSLEEMKIRAEERGFNFPYLYDGDTQEVSRAYGPVATPHVFVFDKERKLRYVGRVDENEKIGAARQHDARNAIEALLERRPVPVAETKTFGCSVKWSDKRSTVQDAFESWAAEPVTLEKIDESRIQDLIKNDSDNLRLINLWATWCGPCVAEFPELVSINRMYRNRNFEMITISADDPGKEADVLAFLKKQQASNKNYLFYTDDNYALIEAVDKEWPGALPYTLIVAPGGEIIDRQLGILDPMKLKRTIVNYLGRYYD